MSNYRISSALRVLFLMAGSVLWAGIWLTGFRTVHWLLYLPAVFFIFGAATGICPAMIVLNMLFAKQDSGQEKRRDRSL